MLLRLLFSFPSIIFVYLQRVPEKPAFVPQLNSPDSIQVVFLLISPRPRMTIPIWPGRKSPTFRHFNQTRAERPRGRSRSFSLPPTLALLRSFWLLPRPIQRETQRWPAAHCCHDDWSIGERVGLFCTPFCALAYDEVRHNVPPMRPSIARLENVQNKAQERQ